MKHAKLSGALHDESLPFLRRYKQSVDVGEYVSKVKGSKTIKTMVQFLCYLGFGFSDFFYR